MGKKSARKPGSVAAIGSKISEELRQAVKDLGGDDEDLQLLQGIDEDDECIEDETARSSDQVRRKLKQVRLHS